jgi:hypothetical protein
LGAGVIAGTQQSNRGGSMKRGLVGCLERIDTVVGGSGGARTLWVIEVPPETVEFDAAVDLAFANECVQPHNPDDVVIFTLICCGDRPKVTSRTAFGR